MKVQAVVATTSRDHDNAWSYSDAALFDLANSAQGKPIIYRKKRIGIVESGIHEQGKAIVKATIFDPNEISDTALFLVPGGLTDFDTVGEIIDTCVAHQFFLTEEPSDRTLTTLEIIDR